MVYYVDVSKYQSAYMDQFKQLGAKGVIAQITVSDSIVAPKAQQQLRSAKTLGMRRLAYHYGTFGHDKKKAIREAKFAVKRAKELGFKTLHIFCDWERNDNDTSGSASQNTAAILAFMRTVHKYGFTTGLYTSASLARTKINTKPIIKEFGSCLWIASYPTMNPVAYSDRNYFPSMDGVTMWQFTSNWHGANVDCNDVVYDPFNLKKVQETLNA